MLKRGIKPILNQELSNKICEQLSLGKSLRDIGNMEGMPCKASICKWLKIYPRFAKEYSNAKLVAWKIARDKVEAYIHLQYSSDKRQREEAKKAIYSIEKSAKRLLSEKHKAMISKTT